MPRPAPALPGLPAQLLQPDKARLPERAELAALIDAQERVPAQAHDASEQPARVQATVGQHQHRPVGRQGWAQQAQHPQPLAPPGALVASGQDGPGDRDGAAAIHHTDDQGDKAVAQAGRIDGQGELGALPQAHDPAQQRHEAGGHIEGRARAPRFVGSVEAPLVQALLDVGDLVIEQQGQKGGHGTASAAAGQGDAIAPPGQQAGLRRGEVRHVA